MELTYHRCGDYLLPNLELAPEDRQPIGKYGRMRLAYLQAHRPGLYTRLMLSGKLIPHLVETDASCKERLDLLIPQMMQQEGVTEQFKASNQMEWVARMNSIHARVEEILRDELIYC